MFRKLVSFDEAKQLLDKSFSAEPLGPEWVSLSKAHTRVLAADVVSPIDVPPFTRSIVDGYAVKAEDTFGANEEKPVTLKLCGNVEIGEEPKVHVEEGSAASIVTGAPLPQGADAVVMVEYTSRRGDTVSVFRPVVLGENLMAAGSDIHEGETVLKQGRILGSREIGVLAAVGLTEVSVYRRPKVALMSTGAEIVAPGEPLPPGKIYDINAYTLSAAVMEAGGESINMGIIPDKKERLREALLKALASADVVITSGGVSVGPKDFTPQVVDGLGKPGVIVSGVAVKPGKPLTIGVVEGKPVFSLPGNPTSSLFMFHMFVRPVIARLAGRGEEELPKIRAVAAKRMFPARGRRTFVMVNVFFDNDGRAVVSPVATGQSGAITTLSKADGFVEISEEQQFIDAGSKIGVYLFDRN